VTGLRRVSASGGDITTLTTPDHAAGEADHIWPEFLPGGRKVLFTVTAIRDFPATSPLSDNSRVEVLDLESGQRTVVLRNASQAKYLTTGHLVYRVATALYAAPFDLDRLAIAGSGQPVVDNIAVGLIGNIAAAISATGTLVYLPEGSPGRIRESQPGLGGPPGGRGGN
jgi:hypothetical protein